MAGCAEGLQIGGVKAPLGRLTDRDDVIDGGGRGPAPGAVWLPDQMCGAELLPVVVVATFMSARPLGVVTGLALPVARDRLGTTLTVLVNAATEAANSGSADRHDQATGAMAGLPSTATAPAAMLVPPALVRARRTYRFEPL